jgi:ketosteroid isomerase-like protein
VAAPNSPGVDRAVDAALNFYEQSAPQVPAKTERSIPSTETRPERNRHRGVNVARQNIKIAKKAYDAFAAADLETVLSTFDDNVEFVVPGNSTISGTYRGKAEVTEFFAKLAEQSFTTTPERFLADDDVVVALGQITAGGESAPEADVLTYRNGKMVKLQAFPDTAMFERVYGRK